MSESKLKRSPYLSQMTKTADTDLMASLSRPDGGSGGSSHGVAGVPKDFFELRRPAGGASKQTTPQARSRPQQRLRSSLKPTGDSSNKIRKSSTSVSFSSDVVVSQSQATLVSTSSGEASIHNSIRNLSLSESSKNHSSEPDVPKPSPLQYYYNPSMRSSAANLDLTNPPARSMTFKDMLDEGDGKEGDLNQRLRNEQWKAFQCLEGPNKKRKGMAARSNGVVSANDLAVMRRSASRMKAMTANATFGMGRSSSSLALSNSMFPTLNEKPSTETKPSPLTNRSEPALKRSYTESIMGTRVHSISAGLAYGSEHIRLMNSCQN